MCVFKNESVDETSNQRKFSIRGSTELIPDYEQLDLYLREHPVNSDYIADFVYVDRELIVTIGGVLIDRGHGIEIVEFQIIKQASEVVDRERDNSNDYAAYRNSERSLAIEILRSLRMEKILTLARERLKNRSWQDECTKALNEYGE